MAKSLTEDFRKLDVRELMRRGFLEPGEHVTLYFRDKRSGPATVSIDVHERYLRLFYSVGRVGLISEIHMLVPISWSICHLGGRRPWFLCPNAECRRRVAILYGNGRFACRHCHCLAYQCQRESDENRADRRANAIRRRLGWMPGILLHPGPHVDPACGWYRPRSMHRSTYQYLVRKHNEFAGRAIQMMGESLAIKLDMVSRQLRKLEQLD